MSGRLVVLRFDDVQFYETWRKYHSDGGREGHIFSTHYLPSPATYCRCGRKPDLKNWRRHRRLGLWVCVTCGRPSKAWRAGLLTRLVEALGSNLET